MNLEIFSDIICPWCYIGTTKLAGAVSQFEAAGGEVELRYRPFLLNAEYSGPSRPTLDYLTERFGPQAGQMTQQVAASAAEVGLELDFARSLIADTRPAHALMEAAFDDGGYPVQRALSQELFADHFTRGLDVADPHVLTEAGRAAGMSETAIENAVSRPGAIAGVEQSLSDAAALGIRAVPTFVADRAMAVQGAQPAAVLLSMLHQAAGDVVDPGGRRAL